MMWSGDDSEHRKHKAAFPPGRREDGRQGGGQTKDQSAGSQVWLLLPPTQCAVSMSFRLYIAEAHVSGYSSIAGTSETHLINIRRSEGLAAVMGKAVHLSFITQTLLCCQRMDILQGSRRGDADGHAWRGI